MNALNSQTWDSVLIGQMFGDYEVTEFIGQGGFGIVMKGVHTNTGDAVAIKVLSPKAGVDDLLDFKNEGDLLSRLAKCSNVVTLMKSDQYPLLLTTQDGFTVTLALSYHILEFADGTLEDLVLERDRLGWIELLLLWRGVIRGVHQMHLRQVVHRDLKSENCLLFVLPKHQTESKVTDLGRSRYLPAPAQHTPHEYLVGRGDMRFAPPEFLTWQGEDTSESHICADIYGLGAILFELVTGLPITHFSLGYHEDVLRKNLQLLDLGQRLDLTGMRSSFEPAYKLFEESVPLVIRQQIGMMLRQLCDPAPPGRLPKLKFSQKSIAEGLGWLLTWTDGLVRALEADAKRAKLASKNSKLRVQSPSLRGA